MFYVQRIEDPVVLARLRVLTVKLILEQFHHHTEIPYWLKNELFQLNEVIEKMELPACVIHDELCVTILVGRAMYRDQYEIINACIDKVLNHRLASILYTCEFDYKNVTSLKRSEKLAYIEAVDQGDPQRLKKIKEQIEQRKFNDKTGYTLGHYVAFPWVIPSVLN